MNELLGKLLALFRKDHLDRDVAEEMQFHLNQRAAAHAEDGFSPEEMHYAARRKFGSVDPLKERCRDERGIPPRSEPRPRSRMNLYQMTLKTRSIVSMLAVAAAVLAASPVFAQQNPAPRVVPLETTDGLHLHNVTAEPTTLSGKKGLRVTIADEAFERMKRTGVYAQGLVRINDLDFSNGVIELEIAGALAPDAGQEARGFVGVAFRVQRDLTTYDAFYLRPTNGRADDQERRNHSTQYISLPEWPWSRLRKETPGKYESYVDLVPGVWTKIKIEVRGAQARLYVHDTEQPALIVNDVKSGADAHGGVALWLEPGTIAHFRNLKVQPSTK